MKQINFIIMGKGGVGKSFVAWVLAQYAQARELNPFCADTDPTNATFKGYQAFNAKHFNISDKSMKIDKTKFDDLIEALIEHDGFSIVDTGSPSFLPMMSYLADNRVFDVLKEAGFRVVVHAPIVGGPAMGETLLGFQSVLESSSAEFVIWENEYFGPISIEGKRLVETQTYQRNRARILGIVNVKSRDGETFEDDMRSLMAQRLTFDEVESGGFKFMQKQRFAMMRRDLFEQLDAIGF